MHAASTVGLAASYFVIEFVLKKKLIPDRCRWCKPPAIDRGIRQRVVWDHRKRADVLSDITGYYGAPLITWGLLFAAAGDDRSARGWYDDAIPVLESLIIVSLLHHAVKFSVGRQRPYAQFGRPGRKSDRDENMSFFSGHTSAAFAVAVSAGVVAEQRGYRLAPAIWASGLTLAAATGYLRMGGDFHYFSDVMVGAVLGTAAGLAVPLLLHRHLDDGASTSVRTVTPLGFGGRF